MKTIFPGRDSAGADGVLHASRCRHGILAPNADAVDEERQDVADDPAVLGRAPRGGEHDEAEGHDGSILNQSPATADPVTDDANENLACLQSIPPNPGRPGRKDTHRR